MARGARKRSRPRATCARSSVRAPCFARAWRTRRRACRSARGVRSPGAARLIRRARSAMASSTPICSWSARSPRTAGSSFSSRAKSSQRVITEYDPAIRGTLRAPRMWSTKTSVSTRKLDPESSRTLFPFVAGGHGEVRVHPKRLVQHPLDIPRPVRADVGVDGITDHSGQGLPLPPTARVQLLDAGHVGLIARDRQGWTSLCRTISAAQLAGEKTKPRATLALLSENAAGLFALTACKWGAVPRAVRAGDIDGAREALARFAAVFGERLYVQLSDHLDPEDAPLCDTLASLAAELGLGCVVTNNVHYARPEGRRLHDVLRCIDLGVTLDEAGNRLKPNGEYWLKGEVMLRERLGRFDEAFRNARAIADACVFELLPGAGRAAAGGRDATASFVGKDRLPGFPVPPDATA